MDNQYEAMMKRQSESEEQAELRRKSVGKGKKKTVATKIDQENVMEQKTGNASSFWSVQIDKILDHALLRIPPTNQ